MKLDDATVDRLRELGATEEMLTWLREPEAVRALLRLNPTPSRVDVACDCGVDHDEAHFRTCIVVTAWRALGDPRGAEDVERAHEEALLDERWRHRTRDGAVFNPRSIMRITNLEAPGTLFAGQPDETK